MLVFHYEFSPSITASEAQALGYEYAIDNYTCRYTPDFYLPTQTARKIYRSKTAKQNN